VTKILDFRLEQKKTKPDQIKPVLNLVGILDPVQIGPETPLITNIGNKYKLICKNIVRLQSNKIL
jgi:hypothetical protein